MKTMWVDADTYQAICEECLNNNEDSIANSGGFFFRIDLVTNGDVLTCKQCSKKVSS